MATTENLHTGDASKTKFSFTFPYLNQTDVEVYKYVTNAWVEQTITTHYTFDNATTIKFGSAPAAATTAEQAKLGNAKNIRIKRNTGSNELAATFYPGSAIRSSDLNDNYTQNLYVTQESENDSATNTKAVDRIVATTNDDGATWVLAGNNTNASTDPKGVGYSVTQAETAVTTANTASTNATNAVSTANTASTTANTAVTTANAATTTANTASTNATNAVSTANAASAAVSGKLDKSGGQMTGNITMSGSQTVDGRDLSSDGSKLDGIETAATADQTNAEIRTAVEAATDSNVFTDADHTKLNAIEASATADQTSTEIKALLASDNLDASHLAANSVTTSEITDLNVTTAKLAADAVTAAKIADDVVNSEHYAAASIDTEHIADANITTVKITDANVTTAKIADNAVTIAKVGCEQTTITDSDSHVPTSGAVVDYVAGQLAPIGGFTAIATEVAFPATASQPANGVIMSISDAQGVVINGSGVSTTGRTTDGTPATVTINGFPSSLYSETLALGVGLMVSSTGSSNTYTYHKLLAAEGDVKQLSDDINDFNARYRVNAGEPGSANDEGDLVYDTSANKMKVYDGSSWGEVTSTGDFKYLYLCPAGGTGAPTINGSIATYDLREGSNSGSAATITSAAQLMVSVNGVVQQANTGTSAPSLGFALVDSNTIIFGANLPTSAEVFIVQFGSALTINTPGDGTVTTAKIAAAAVTTAKIADDAVDGSKLANNIDIAGTLDVTGNAVFDAKIGIGNASPAAALDIKDSTATKAYFKHSSSNETSLYVESDDTSARIGSTYHAGGGAFKPLAFLTSGSERMRIASDGKVGIGTSSPEDLLHISDGASGTSESSNAQLVLESGASTNYLVFQNPNDQNAGISWKDAGGQGNAVINYDHNTDDLWIGADDDIKLATAGTARLTISAAGIGTFASNLTTNAKLSINGSGVIGDTANAIELWDDAATTKTFTVTGGGAATFAGALVVNRAVSGDGCFHAQLNGTTKASITSAGDLTAEACTLARITAGSATATGFYSVNAGTNSSFGSGWAAIYARNATAGGRVIGVLNAAANAETVTILENGAATFASTVTCTSVTETSDIALKTDIEPITNVLDKIQQITGYTYKFKSTGHDSMGVTAQDVEKVFPELVHGEDGSKSLQYSGLIGALIESVKELSNKVAALEAA